MSSYVYCATCGEEKADVDACTCSDCAEDYDRITRGQIADLKRQLAEARRKAFEEAVKLVEGEEILFGPEDYNKAVHDIAEALREAGKK